MLFMRGNAMSGAPIMIGTIQLAKPPISAGMTMKKIMMRRVRGGEHVEHVLAAVDGIALEAVNHLRQPWKIWMPGSCSSVRMITESAPPTMPAQ